MRLLQGRSSRTRIPFSGLDGQAMRSMLGNSSFSLPAAMASKTSTRSRWSTPGAKPMTTYGGCMAHGSISGSDSTASDTFAGTTTTSSILTLSDSQGP
eukprot:UN2456